MTMNIEVEFPDDLRRFSLPPGVAARLQSLLDRQDSGHALTLPEREEAEGLVNMADLLTLLRMRIEPRGRSPKRSLGRNGGPRSKAEL